MASSSEREAAAAAASEASTPLHPLICGLNVTSIPCITDTITYAYGCGFSFIVSPICHPRFRRPAPTATRVCTSTEATSTSTATSRVPLCHAGPFTRSDLILTNSEWSDRVIGCVSPWIDLDSTVTHVRTDSEAAFVKETSWAHHIGLQAVILPTPRRNGVQCANYGRLLNELVVNIGVHSWIRIPLSPPCVDFGGEDVVDTSLKGMDPWKWWDDLRMHCDGHLRLGVALEVTPDLPSDIVLDRWLGEPLRTLLLPTRAFVTNKRGFPVLSKRHQSFIRKCLHRGIQVIFSGNPTHSRGIVPYLQYIRHLYATLDAPTDAERFIRGYEDVLQSPLQPLMDNLEAATYEVFERDPVKYARYEEAVRLALLDRVSDEDASTLVTVIMVVGAGRGPLVAASLRAADSVGRSVRVYAVEKNVNAVVTLQNRVCEEWGKRVTVVSCDMREWVAPEQADILVSELLGSFGDNELSPECLDGAQSFLKSNGVSIPYSYTSYLAPLSSQKLHNEVRGLPSSGDGGLKSLETSYVVSVQNAWELATAQPCFTFSHPNSDVESCTVDNKRYMSLQYKARTTARMHGFVGYFEAMLYKDVMISILPETFSTGMFSWFPIYFPLRESILVNEGETINTHFWRCTTNRKVWYEWCLAGPRVSAVHNLQGRSSWIGL